MRNGPEFLAVGVWCLFVAVIAVAHGTGTPDVTSKPMVTANADTFVAASEKVTSGRSAALSVNNGPYGALFVDPSLQLDPEVYKGPKPTSADLTAK